MKLNDDERTKGRGALLQIDLSLKCYDEIKTSANLLEKENQSSRKNSSFTSETEDEDFEKLLDRQANAAKLNQKMRMESHLHFDCSKWTSTTY